MSNYCDGFEPALNNVFNVGWIDSKDNYSSGESSIEVITKLKELAFGQYPFKACFRISRGFATCSVCSEIVTTKYNGEKTIIGSFSMLIPSIKEDEFFVVPSTIIHLIEDHQYIPPRVFLDSLDQVDLTLESNAEKIMKDLLDE